MNGTPVNPQLLEALVADSHIEDVFDSQLHDALANAMGQLPDRSSSVLQGHVDGHTLRSIAEDVEISLVHTHRLRHAAAAAMAVTLQNEPSVMRRLERASGKFVTWQAAAADAAADIESYGGELWWLEVDKALARLTELRDLMARAWVKGEVDLEADHLLLEAGSIALANAGTSLRDIVAVVIDKQRSYGVGNILAFGLVGIAVRMSDKVERLKNLVKTGYTPEHSEPLADTWLDIVGYAIVAVMLLRGTFELPLADASEVAA
jgi:hypothetical protein